MSLRTERLAEQLQGEIVRVLREEVTDPRIGIVTLTRVDLAPDLSQAIVHWSPLESKDPDRIRETEQGLASAAAFLRRRIAGALQLRKTPALDFRYDAAFEEGARTLELLQSVEMGTADDE